MTLLVALSVFISPLARELCLLNCAGPSPHAAHDPTTSSGGACHESDTSSAPVIGGVPSGCGHDGSDPPSTMAVAAAEYRSPMPAVAALPSLAGPHPDASGWRAQSARAADLSGASSFSAPVPLRI